MNYIEDLPEAHFGEVSEESEDWRKDTDKDDDNDEDEDIKTPDDVIEMLGFDPDEEGAEGEGEDSTKEASARTLVLKEVMSEIQDIRKQLQSQVHVSAADAKKTSKPDPEPPVNSGNTGGITYKGYSIKQNHEGLFNIYSIGGALIVGQVQSLELAMNRINEIAIKGSE